MVLDSSSIAAGDMVGQWRIERPLPGGRSWLAEAAGRRAVLKPLHPDCLLKHRLHPLIHDRLAHLRGLAHLELASLIEVQRSGGRVIAVWQFIAAETLEEFTERNADISAAQRAQIALTLALAVQSLHDMGVVHGAIHERNVFVTADRQVRLTHVSPLLHDDPSVDTTAVTKLIEMIGLRVPAAASLRELAINLGDSDAPAAMSAGETTRREPVPETARIAGGGLRSRRTALIGAALLAVMGAALALMLWYLADQASLADWSAPL